MSDQADGDQSRRERLSALADGAVSGAELQEALNDWRGDPELRAAWHTYHLIGDALRSDELVGRGVGHDQAFLHRLRSRLASEPLIVAPESLSRPAPRSGGRSGASSSVPRVRRWALAAGFAAVCTIAVLAGYMGLGQLEQLQPQLAQSGLAQSNRVPAAGTVAQQGLRQSPASPESAAAADAVQAVATDDGKILRDARLDQYLLAHKQFGGSSALQLPAGFIRNATLEGPGR